MQIRKRAFGLAVGLVWGFAVLLITWWLLIIESPGRTISKLSLVYYGYSFSWGGALIGFLWGLLDGFIAGVLIAWLYNFFSNKIYKTS
jgi:hypothetical protein